MSNPIDDLRKIIATSSAPEALGAVVQAIDKAAVALLPDAHPMDAVLQSAQRALQEGNVLALGKAVERLEAMTGVNAPPFAQGALRAMAAAQVAPGLVQGAIDAAEQARQLLLDVRPSKWESGPSNPVDDIRKMLRAELEARDVRQPLAAVGPVQCPTCLHKHERRTAQGHVMEEGSLLLCMCGAALRVPQFAEHVGLMAEVIDTKTCTVAEFKAIDSARQEQKRARRQWAQHQANNREAARRKGVL